VSETTTDKPRNWRWDDDGDVVEGAYVELGEAHTRRDGDAKPILVLEVDGEPRTVWLFHKVLRSQLRRELLRRPEGEFRVGEQIRIERLGEVQPENGGNSYVNYRATFAESPTRSPLDILGGDDDQTGQPAEPEKADGDDDIPF